MGIENKKDLWTVIIIIALLVGVVVLYQMKESANQEVVGLQNQLAIAKNIESIDSKLDDMRKRDEEIYPQLRSQLADLDDARKQFNAAEAKLRQPKRGDVANEVNVLNQNEVSRMLSDLGYPTSVRECK